MSDACRHALSGIGAFYPHNTLRFESTGELSGMWDAARISQMLSNLVDSDSIHLDSVIRDFVHRTPPHSLIVF